MGLCNRAIERHKIPDQSHSLIIFLARPTCPTRLMIMQKVKGIRSEDGGGAEYSKSMTTRDGQESGPIAAAVELVSMSAPPSHGKKQKKRGRRTVRQLINSDNDSLQRDDLPRYLGVSLDPRLSLRRHIEEVANSVRERTRVLQKLAGTNWGATPQSLRTIYVSFIRPVLEYANPVLNLASRTSLEKLDRVQNAALRLVLGALRSTPIAILEITAGCEPLGIRRGEQTVFAQERYLPTGEGEPLKDMVEEFATQHRRIKKVSVLSVANDLSNKYCVPTDREPLPVPS
ncbi:hypothetical protein PoB_001071400 [Plakobranchus ocellatus]|uniref:Uncharacterized protein n=1 Tax=Plakobranchus ocellatus TaxID=259542 RepID=A0AAV3YMG6_9GAST|nr:hypothetical protein PoB_001071400 [Plakobranchus ocellatus]